MRIRDESSLEYIEKWRQEMAEKDARRRALIEGVEAMRSSMNGTDEWRDMAECPFDGLDHCHGISGAILVSDRESTAVVTVHKRFGRPVFFKGEREMVIRDGVVYVKGGEIDPRPDLPAWWWVYELRDAFGDDVHCGDSVWKAAIDFVPTVWRFIPVPKSKE